ncbi:MAG: hypothetical protein GWN00_05145 [Aliifodinibius sp.]|nr:hypothetical protein [Fodinibius sp.]NIV10587.1 hypothetical protein [Fodinibius sp.]NIY24215.1 hypothetical protein [Fodinibius sp.]
MFDSKQTYEMIYEEARLLNIPMWVNYPGVTDKESEAFQARLLTCSTCAEEYEETKEIVSLVRDHWGSISKETLNLLGQDKRSNQLQNQRSLSRRHAVTVEEGWEDLKRRIPELAQLEKSWRHLQLLRRVSAVAACLVIGVFIWMAFPIYPRPEIAQESVPEQVAFFPKASIICQGPVGSIVGYIKTMKTVEERIT